MTTETDNEILKKGEKVDIIFDCYASRFSDGTATIFQFWPDGEWDEDKHSLEEALQAYPPAKYNWIKAENDD